MWGSKSRNIRRIGILTKLQNNEDGQITLYVLTVSKSIDVGVHLWKWDDFKLSIQKQECFYRHLYCNRDNMFILNTEKFLESLKTNRLTT